MVETIKDNELLDIRTRNRGNADVERLIEVIEHRAFSNVTADVRQGRDLARQGEIAAREELLLAQKLVKDLEDTIKTKDAYIAELEDYKFRYESCAK